MRRIWAFTLTLLFVGCAAEEPEVVVEEEESTVTIRSVGDILVHSDVYTAARTDTGFDFSRMFEPVRAYMQDADITTANMEVPVAGEEFGLSGYPQFNAPPEIIDALKNSGVDIVNNATNHSMDRGGEGVIASTGNMRERGMLYAGSFSSAADAATPRIIEANGITVGFLGFTYGTNGLPVEEEHFASLIDDNLTYQITTLDSQVDVTVVMLHMGDEYAPLQNEFQEETAAAALEAGADLVLGGHPHVVEPFDGPVWTPTATSCTASGMSRPRWAGSASSRLPSAATRCRLPARGSCPPTPSARRSATTTTCSPSSRLATTWTFKNGWRTYGSASTWRW